MMTVQYDSSLFVSATRRLIRRLLRKPSRKARPVGDELAGWPAGSRELLQCAERLRL